MQTVSKAQLTLGVIALAAIVTSLNRYVEVTTIRTEAIERGYAIYCPTTGNFAWKGEC